MEYHLCYMHCILKGTPEYLEKFVLDSQEQDYYELYTLQLVFTVIL